MGAFTLATDMRQIRRTSVLPRVKAILGAVDILCPDPIAYLMYCIDSLTRCHNQERLKV